MKRALVTVIAVVSALGLAACGGDGGSDTSSPSEWADNLCTDVSTWRSSVASVGDSLSGGGLSQDELQNAANDVGDATETLVGELQDLGRPDTEAGQEAEDAVDQLAEQLQTDIGEIERAADEASGGAGVIQAASAVGMTLTTMGNQITEAATSLQQGEAQAELRSAFQQSDACNDLTRSS